MKVLFRHQLSLWRNTESPGDHPLARHPLVVKLAIVTAIKLLVLMVLWWAFFSGNGEGGGSGMTPDQAAEAILHIKITGTNEIINATK